jgi:hypothetical protein
VKRLKGATEQLLRRYEELLRQVADPRRTTIVHPNMSKDEIKEAIAEVVARTARNARNAIVHDQQSVEWDDWRDPRDEDVTGGNTTMHDPDDIVADYHRDVLPDNLFFAHEHEEPVEPCTEATEILLAHEEALANLAEQHTLLMIARRSATIRGAQSALSWLEVVVPRRIVLEEVLGALDQIRGWACDPACTHLKIRVVLKVATTFFWSLWNTARFKMSGGEKTEEKKTE